MHWQSTPYTLLLLLTSLIAAALTGFAGRKRTAPLITLLVVWTNDYHHLFHRRTVLENSDPFSILDVTYGPFFLATHGLLLYLASFWHVPATEGMASCVLLSRCLDWSSHGAYFACGYWTSFGSREKPSSKG
jgi:hypothetical protein